MEAQKLLIIIPHGSIKRPSELKKEWLSEYQRQFLFSETAETDRETDKLYDFRDILENQQLVFPISQVYINVCRSPKNIDEATPLYIGNLPIYKRGKEPSIELRKGLLGKYYFPFYEDINKRDKNLILNCHSTIGGHRSLGNEKLKEDIVLSDCLEYNEKIMRFAPAGYIDFYASELKKRLPELKIGKNSIYFSVIENICLEFGERVSVIHQETDESLYIKNNRADRKKLGILKKVFAESIFSTMKHFRLL